MADGGADGGDVTDVLHHGSQSDGDDGEQGADELGAAVDGKEAHGFLVERDAEPCGGGNALKVHGTGHKGDCVGDENANQDGQDLDHALAPDVADDDRTQSHKGQQPVCLTVADGRGGEDEADGDDDGACDHRREEAHDAPDAEGGDEQADGQIEQTREGHACAGVGQHLGVGNGQIAVGVSQHGSHDGEAAQIGKGRAEEGRDLALGDKVEQQRTQTCAEQGGRNAQTGEQGDQHGGTKHGEHVLDAQDQHPSGTQLAGVVNALGVINILTHYFLLLSAAQKKRHYRGKAAMPQKSGPNRKRKIQPMRAKDDFFFSILLSPFLSFFGIV